MRIAGLIVAATAFALVAAGANADPVKIRAGWSNTPTAMAPIIFAKPELAKHLGKTYTMEPVHFRGSAPEITALASGDLDIATLAPSSLSSAIENAHLSDIRVIGDENQDGDDPQARARLASTVMRGRFATGRQNGPDTGCGAAHTAHTTRAADAIRLRERVWRRAAPRWIHRIHGLAGAQTRLLARAIGQRGAGLLIGGERGRPRPRDPSRSLTVPARKRATGGRARYTRHG